MSNLCYTISAPGHLGDILCMISAAHTFARVTGAKVLVNQCVDVVRCYDDGLLHCGEEGVRIILDVYGSHRQIDGEHVFRNYLGTFVKPLLPSMQLPIDFELPQFTQTTPRCLIQPFSRTAQNPPLKFIQAMVDQFHSLTGEQLFAIGDLATPRTIRNIDYSLLENSAPRLMAHIANARCVLSPRSASAHISAAYKRAAFVWLPADRENWHLNYEGWRSRKIPYEMGESFARGAMIGFCAEVLSENGHGE